MNLVNTLDLLSQLTENWASLLKFLFEKKSNTSMLIFTEECKRKNMIEHFFLNQCP